MKAEKERKKERITNKILKAENKKQKERKKENNVAKETMKTKVILAFIFYCFFREKSKRQKRG